MPATIDKATRDRILAEIDDSAFALGYRHGAQWALIWNAGHDASKPKSIRDRKTIDPSIPTLAISADGRLYISPTYWASLSGPERQGVLAHEMLHPVMRHFERAQALGLIDSEGKAIEGRSGDLVLWNIAGDMAINPCLIESGLTLPRGCVIPPPGYSGPRDTESIWHWLRSQAQQQPQGGGGSGRGKPGQGESDSRGSAAPGQGCGTLPPEDSGQGQGKDKEGGSGEGPEDHPIDWEKVARDAKAIAETTSGISKGSTAFARLLEPAPARIPWQKVLGAGFSIADTRRGNERPTYSKIARRQSVPFIRPGWIQTVPRVCVIVDCSGSMDRAWLDRVASEVIRLMAQYQGGRAYLIAHTDRVEWQGWIAPGSKAQLEEAFGRTGGTCAREAYEIAGSIGKFDCTIHFTDCELSGAWPDSPIGSKLVIGAFGNGATNPYCHPPDHARVIPCTLDG